MSLDKLNKQLAAAGAGTIKDVDEHPERTEYLEHLLNGDRSEDGYGKKLKYFKEQYILTFYKHFAVTYPYFLFEIGDDKTYWNYDDEIGIYEELTLSSACSLVIDLFIKEGFEEKGSEAAAKSVLAKYRARFLKQGVKYDAFDTQANLFHAANGWVNVDTLEFTDHTPDLLSRRVSAVKYDPEATCARYDQFLDTDIEVAADAVRVMDQYSGLFLTPDIQYEKMLTLIGRPASGKSTLVNIWSHILGDMATQKKLTEISGDSARFIGSSLTGKTLCWFDEVDVKRSEMGNALVTMITGEHISIERKGITAITQANNTMKCVLTANNLPLSSEHGMYRRMILVYFDRSFYDEGTVNSNIGQELKAEASGILNRMLRGLADLRKYKGFTVIAGHEDLIEEYKGSSDAVAEFLQTYFEPAEGEEIEASTLFQAFKSFKEGDNFVKGLTPQKFGLMMRAQPLSAFSKITKKHYKDGNRWIGLKVKSHLKINEYGRIEVNNF